MMPIEEKLRRRARAGGFAALRIADPAAAVEAGERLRDFLALEREGDMAWLGCLGFLGFLVYLAPQGGAQPADPAEEQPHHTAR